MAEERSPGVVSVTEIWDGGRQSGIDEFGNRHYTRHWNVKVDDVKVDALEATANGQLPAMFSTYVAPNGGLDRGASLRGYECQQQESGVLWRVTASYSSAKTQTSLEYNPTDYGSLGGPGGGFQTGNALETDPLLRAPSIRFGTLRTQRTFPRDLDKKAFVASNGQRLDPPVMVDRSYIVLAISRNEATGPAGGPAIFNPDTIVNFKDKVNSVQWNLTHILINNGVTWPVAAGIAKCEEISAESQVEQKKIFWRVNYVFHINPFKKKLDNDTLVFEGWQPEVLDVGTYETIFAPLFGWIRPLIFDKLSCMPITSPVPLNGTGQELVPTGSGPEPTFSYKYRSFRTYESIDFNTLLLP